MADVLSLIVCMIRLLQKPHTVIQAGQEGFEPPSPGFGVRCSTVRATGLQFRDSQIPRNLTFSLPRFPMRLMLTTKAAVFFELKSLRGTPLIFRRRVVAAPTFDTRQSNQIPHRVLLTLSPRTSTARGDYSSPHQRDPPEARRNLRQDFANDARPYGASALTDRKAQLFLQSNRRD